jgi:hypothetical protein
MLTVPEIQAARNAIPFKPIDCPHCSVRLNRHLPIVIATRNCPVCGKRVAAEPQPVAAGG